MNDVTVKRPNYLIELIAKTFQLINRHVTTINYCWMHCHYKNRWKTILPLWNSRTVDILDTYTIDINLNVHPPLRAQETTEKRSSDAHKSKQLVMDRCTRQLSAKIQIKLMSFILCCVVFVSLPLLLIVQLIHEYFLKNYGMIKAWDFAQL